MKCILVENYKEYNLEEFIKKQIVQKDISLKSIYDGMDNFNYKYIICVKNNECVGVLPIILYKNDIANIINSLPFIGYGGISLEKGREEEEIFRCIIDFLLEYAQQNNVLLTTICTEPFEDKKYELYKKYFKPDFERENFHQYIDLNGYNLDNVKRRIKRSIKKCTEMYGVKIIESNKEEDLLYWYENIYLERLNKTGCAIYPYSVFKEFLKKMECGRSKMIYGIKDGEIIGGGLFLNQNKSIDNFMRVVGTPFLDTQVGTYLDYYSIKYALDNNIKYYNWQSCDYIGSSIFEYKESWGSKLAYHYYLTKITGDISKLEQTSLDTIKQEFKGIYVMPYEEFER